MYRKNADVTAVHGHNGGGEYEDRAWILETELAKSGAQDSKTRPSKAVQQNATDMGCSHIWK